MSNHALYRTLVPDAPMHRRTESDPPGDVRFKLRTWSSKWLEGIAPSIPQPRLVSSYAGVIDRVLFCFPAWSASSADLIPAYRSVLSALRAGTRFVVAHHASIRPELETWFLEAGHAGDAVEWVELPDYVNLTDWAEDAYVVVEGGNAVAGTMVEPWEFRRAGDALIADAVERRTDIRASQVPLVFQGGNCLIGDSFWFLGKDYFADTVRLLAGEHSPVDLPKKDDADNFVRGLFSSYVEAERELIVIGTRKALPVRPYVGSIDAHGTFYLDLADDGVGTFQPIFHIDMFVSLVGRLADGRFQVLVGSIALGDAALGTKSPLGLTEVYDDIAAELTSRGFAVERNPLVHRPTLGKSYSLAELKAMAAAPDNVVLVPAVQELATLGARDETRVTVRAWHHVTWNNCLVENSGTHGRHVYLPTFGHGANADLAPLDAAMTQLWERLGFTVHALGDFNEFARRQGVVHCIKKYLARGG
jgi:hypothetical protein